ncbi:MAG TPA: Ppx/GppA phosphatase family protein [Longimicrobium sp.]|nr:Ppx/GppA phosphatase family protein [Longimicrobium sp.]
MPRDEIPAAEQAPAFPLRVAAIDVGSNAIRFAAAEFASAAEHVVLDEARHAVRLGHEVFLSGRLAPDALDAAVRALADFRARMDALGVRHYRAVATSAAREARNGAELVERARAEAGVELEVITGTEEARLVYLGVAGRVPLGDKKWILVDLGGGSVEVSLVDSAGILWTESHTVGSVRLLEELSGAGQEPGRFQRLLREYAASLSIPVLAQQWNPAGVIATGGNIDALARLTGSPGDRVAELPLAELRRLIDTLGSLSYRQRVEQMGLKPDRADVIVPAAMVYERVAALAGADRILVPGVGLRDGLLADLVDDLATHQAHEDRKERHAIAGAVALGRRYLFNERHALHVARLAGSLFDQLAEVHGLGAEERRMLLAAAVLHDIGIFVGYKKHHKHSHYLVSQSELPEFTPRETEIIAHLARYHRKGVPAEHHESFTALPGEDRQLVLKLASLLRLADGMDREHRQAVRAVRATVARRRLSLELEGDGDLLLERWAVRRKAGLFTDTFGLEVVVGEGPAA